MSFYAVRLQGYSSQPQKMIFQQEPPGNPSDALEFLEKWLMDGNEPYCALLGEYGMGKTTTSRMFTLYLMNQRIINPTLPVPIYIDLRNLPNKASSNEKTITDIIDSVLKNTPTIDLDQFQIPYKTENVLNLLNENNALIIFDGLDEVFIHISLNEAQHCFRKMLSIIPRTRNNPSKNRILITCRTHFFRTLREQKSFLTGQDRDGFQANDYRIFNLMPFTEEQIFDYLKHTLPQEDTTKLMKLFQSVHNLPELAERPFLLSLIPQLIPHIEQAHREGKTFSGVMIYRHIVYSWLERDLSKHTLNTAHKQELMECLSAEMWRSGKNFIDINTLEQWFVNLVHTRPKIFSAYPTMNEFSVHTMLEKMKEDLRTATFLVRTEEKDFRFAHTSLQEFFLASYLCRALIEGHLEDWKMPTVSIETLDFLGQLLSEVDVSIVCNRLETLRHIYQPYISEMAFRYMIHAHLKNYPTPEISGFCMDNANLQGLFIDASAENNTNKNLTRQLDLTNTSFRGACLKNAYFKYLNFAEVDFSNADMSEIEVAECNMHSATFIESNFSSAYLRYVNFEHANFNRTTIDQTEWVGCQFKGCKNLNTDSISSLFILCDLPESQKKMVESTEALIIASTFSPDGNAIATASWDKKIKIWDIGTGECIQSFSYEDYIYDCTYCPDGSALLVAGGDKTLKVYHIETGHCLLTMNGHISTIRGCAASPCGNYFASASSDCTLRIWDTHTGNNLFCLEDHQSIVTSCAFSPDGQFLVSTADDKTLRVWHVLTGRCIHVLKGHTHWIRQCSYSPDGRYIASASGDKTIRVWDAQTGECVHVLKGHEKRVRCATFSPKEHYLVSTSDDTHLHVWNLSTGKCEKILKGHHYKVRSCLFSSTGILASASKDIKLWNINTGECIRTIDQTISCL